MGSRGARSAGVTSVTLVTELLRCYQVTHDVAYNVVMLCALFAILQFDFAIYVVLPEINRHDYITKEIHLLFDKFSYLPTFIVLLIFLM